MNGVNNEWLPVEAESIKADHQKNFFKLTN